MTQRLLQLMKENPDRRGLDLLRTIAEELGVPDTASIVAAGTALLADLRERNILLGTRVDRALR